MESLSIQLDYATLCNDLLNIIDSLERTLKSNKIQVILAEDLQSQIESQLQHVRKRLSREFCLMVLGDFKRGKSTLINALLGAQIAPTNITPETVTLNYIMYGPEPRAEAYLQDGRKVLMRHEDIWAEKLFAVMDQAQSGIDRLEIRIPIEGLKGLCIIDTPGTGDIFKRYDDQVTQYLAEADAIVFVISALSPLSETETMFLRFSVSPQDFPRIFFVVNMMDLVHSSDDFERISKAVKKKLLRTFPNAGVFCVSALDEMCRRENMERPESSLLGKLKSNFDEFRTGLEDTRILNLEIVRLSRAISAILKILDAIHSHASLLLQAMNSDRDQLGNTIAQLEEQSSQLYSSVELRQKKVKENLSVMAEQAATWMDEFLDRIQDESVRQIASFDFQKVRRNYYFFLSEVLEDAMRRCVEAHLATIIDDVGQSCGSLMEEFSNLINRSAISCDPIAANLCELSWSNIDSLRMVLDTTSMGFISDIFFNTALESGKLSHRSRFEEKLVIALKKLKNITCANLDRIYNQELPGRIGDMIEGNCREKIESTLSTLRQTSKLAQLHEQGTVASREALNKVFSVIEKARSECESLKQKLNLGASSVILEEPAGGLQRT